jgi:hypothetical protein
MPKNTAVKVPAIPKCDFCDAPAGYDGRTNLRGPNVPGPWANMCEADFKTYGVGLGLGSGQRLIKEE